MKFKIHQISRLTGFSASTIRFYEKAGVISPSRTKNANYRDFALHELQLLLMCKGYRDCGFSLPESVELLNHADVKQLDQSLECQYDRIEQEIKKKELLLEFLKRKRELLQGCQQDPGNCQPFTMPPQLRLKLWQPGDAEDDHVAFPELYKWFDLMPFCDSSLVLQQEQVIRGAGELKTRWYVNIDEEYANQLGFNPKAKAEYLPATKCIRTIVPITENLTILGTHLDPLRECLSNQQYEVTGPAISKILYHTNLDGMLKRFDQLWVPVR